MWPFINLINLNRYLVVWKVNRSLVKLPPCLSVELSLVLGTLIAERLPTPQARPWRKALAKWGGYIDKGLPPTQKDAPVPQAAWPVEAVLFAYPLKQTYGQGELIVWALELIGHSADHGLFLELVLPAMEEASATTDPRWHRPNSLWGRFDIQAIYASRGPRWEPVVREGKVDLHYRATPVQWAEGLELGLKLDRTLDRLTWLTPFDLGSRIADRGSQIADRGSRIADRGSQIADRGSRIADRGSRIADRGSRIADRQSQTDPSAIRHPPSTISTRQLCPN